MSDKQNSADLLIKLETKLNKEKFSKVEQKVEKLFREKKEAETIVRLKDAEIKKALEAYDNGLL